MFLFHQGFRRVDHIVAVALFHNNDACPLIHQLQHVMVPREDENLHLRAEPGGQRTDAIVRFITRAADIGNPQAFHNVPYDRKLRNQLIRRLRAVAFISRKLLRPERFAAQIPTAGDMRRGKLLNRVPKIPHKSINRIRRQPRFGASDITRGRRSIIGSEHQGHPVNQQNALPSALSGVHDFARFLSS
ncbi:hypothetical protein D1872_254260 [compost metagenome]